MHALSSKQCSSGMSCCRTVNKFVLQRPAQRPRRAVVNAMPRWEEMWMYLTKEKQLASVDPTNAKEMVDSGDWVIVDCRLPGDYESSHPEGAVGVALYRPVDFTKPNPASLLRSLLFAANGVKPVEPNPDFTEQARVIAKTGKGMITMCEAGGTLKPTANFPCGKASRSLQSAYIILKNGVSDKVVHLDGGAYGWYKAGLPFEGEYDTSNAGRSPNVAQEASYPVRK